MIDEQELGTGGTNIVKAFSSTGGGMTLACPSPIADAPLQFHPPRRTTLSVPSSLHPTSDALAGGSRLRVEDLEVAATKEEFTVAYQSILSAVLLRAMHYIADGLATTVSAEGAETICEAEILRGLGCDELQGFLFDHPIEPDVLGCLFATVPSPRAPGLSRRTDLSHCSQ